MSDGRSALDRLPSPTAGSAVLVAQHFLPLNVVSSQRALRMARTLLGRFHRVYVLYGDTSTAKPALLDHDYGRDVLTDPRLVRISVRPGLTRYGYGATTSVVERLAAGLATRIFCSPGFDWIGPLRRALAGLSPAETIRLVVATGPPFITFGTAAQFAAKRQAAAILDYRDLWTSNPHGRYPSLARWLVNRRLERPLNRKATAITTVSQGCRAWLVGNEASARVRVLYNSPDQSYLEHYRRIVADWRERRVGSGERARQRYRIVFTGHVHPTCTFVPLLKAVVALPEPLRDRLEIHYYGDSSVVARSEFQQFGLSNLLTDHGAVSKDDSLRAMLDADLLLSLIHTDRVSSDPAVTGHMSTKIYDYFLSGIPVLNIGPLNAEVNDLAAQIGHAAFYSAPADDTAGIARLLEELAGSSRPMPGEALRLALPDFERAFSVILDETVADR